jgi:diguanylate cyclase (GGDEF)-like protein/PAS domain S-box-containing protein
MGSESNRGRKGLAKTAEGTSPPGDHVIARHVIFSLGIVLLYLLLNLPQVILISQLGVTVWFPATGLILAVMLSITPRYFPLAVLAETLAGVLIYHQPLLSWGELAGPLLGAGSYAAAAFLLRGPLKVDPELRFRRDVVRYISVTMAAALLATAVGVACLAADHTILWSQYWDSALKWYAGDAIGLVGFAPFLLIHVLPRVQKLISPSPAGADGGSRPADNRLKLARMEEAFEAIGQAISIVLVLWVMFGPVLGSKQLYYLGFVPIIWIAMRQGIRRVVSGLLIFNLGIVVAFRIFPAPPDLLAKVGWLMLTLSATGLITAAAVTERHRIARQLGDRTTILNSLIENNPLGIVVRQHEGKVQLCNDAFAEMFLYKREELIGQSLDALILPSDGASPSGELSAQLTTGQPLHEIVRRVRKDGKILHLEIHAVPIILDGRTRGAYEICQDVSEQVKATAAAKEHAESLNSLVTELQLRTTQMTLLNEMGDLLQCCESRQEAFGVVERSARKLFSASTAGALFVFNASRNAAEAAASWGNRYASEQAFSSDACWALRRGQAHWSEHPGDGVMCPHLTNPVAASYLCVPIVARGDTLGILHVQYDRSASAGGTEAFETLQQSQKRLAVAVAGQVGLSLGSLRMWETLRDQSIRDPLTGLFNRRFLQESLEREWQRAKRKNLPLSVVILDLDRFKRFNDVFGHDAGDTILRSMAELFRQHYRREDVVCRYGGEEFAIILPESSARDAAKRSEELRVAAKKLEVLHKGKPLDPVTLSIGVAAYPEHAATVEGLLRIADACLYKSKSGGRNRVTTASTHES